MLFLGKRQAPARRMIDAGCAVALATDFNPGSSPVFSLPLMAMLGVSQLGLLPAEAITAITVNGAAGVGEAESRGRSRRASGLTSRWWRPGTGARCRIGSELTW